MANQHTKLPYNTTSGAVPSAYSAENDNGIKAGELAVNLYQGQEFLVTRNENGNIIKFSSDNLALFEKGSGANSIQQKGTSCTASGDKSFAMGDGTTASGYCAYAEGSQTSGSGNYSHAEGAGTTASGMGSHAEGNQTKAFGDNSHAEGAITAAIGDNSHAEGYRTMASGSSSHAEGRDTSAFTEAAHAEGSGTTASGNCAHAEGDSTTGGGHYSHAEGQRSFAQGIATHAEGLDTHANSNAAHAEGYETKATGAYSHTEGRATSATTYEAHAEGSGTTASAEAAHAEGEGTSATSEASHAEGHNTLASGNYSHAKGQSTIASGQSSHAEGRQTSALTEATHAEGSTTLANGKYSHAEGSGTYTEGQASHAEGINTSAMTNYSHAEGAKSLAAGLGSHAEGNYAIANNSNEHASGIYNKSHITGASEWDDLQGTTTSTGTVEPFTGTSTLFSVGFGSTGLRRNALEVTRQGQTLLNSRKTYFRYADASADMGDQSYAATGTPQYQTTPGVAEYITMFDVIEKVREGDNYAVFEKGPGVNSIQQKGTNCVASGANSVAIGSGTTARFSDEFVCGYYNKYPSGHLQGSTLFSIGNGFNDTNRRNAVIVKLPDQISPTLPTNHVEVFVSGDLHSGKFVRNRTITASTGSSSLSALTSEIGSGDSIIFINNSNYSGGTSDSIFISSGSTMLRGQTVMLYFTKPMKIGEIKTETEQAFPEIISKVKVYYHIDGSVSTTDGSSAAAFLSLYTFTAVEITKIGNRDALDDSGMDSYVIEFRNVKDA